MTDLSTTTAATPSGQANIALAAAATASTAKRQPTGKAKAAEPKPKSKASQTQGQLLDYVKLGIAQANIARIEDLRGRFADVGRLSTEQVFTCGALVAELRDLAPDQASFEAMVKPVFGLTRKGAENYARVHRHLQAHRKRLVEGGVVATVLYHLAGAEPDQVEQALAVREAGEKLTVARTKVILGTAEEPSGAKPEDGGAAGLKARIAEKTALGVDAVMADALALLEQLQVALEPHRQGKRIVVKDVQRAFIHPARLLRQRLESLTWLAGPVGGSAGPEVVHMRPLTRDDQWHELWGTLDKVGGFESWPPAGQVGTWLTETVVPQLEWLLGARAAKANAVVNKMAKRAEADALKAQKAAEKASRDKKKARDKAAKQAAANRKRAQRDAKAAAKAAKVEADQPNATNGEDEPGHA